MDNIKLRRLKRNKKRRRRTITILFSIVLVILAAILLSSFVFYPTRSDKVYYTYTVGYGDTLWSIAREIYGDSCDIRYKIDDIERENGIMDSTIYPGMQLLVEVE